MKKASRTFNCPTEFALSVLGGKWKTIILAYLRERPCGAPQDRPQAEREDAYRETAEAGTGWPHRRTKFAW
jgi:hypothetical protein